MTTRGYRVKGWGGEQGLLSGQEVEGSSSEEEHRAECREREPGRADRVQRP